MPFGVSASNLKKGSVAKPIVGDILRKKKKALFGTEGLQPKAAQPKAAQSDPSFLSPRQTFRDLKPIQDAGLSGNAPQVTVGPLASQKAEFGETSGQVASDRFKDAAGQGLRLGDLQKQIAFHTQPDEGAFFASAGDKSITNLPGIEGSEFKPTFLIDREQRQETPTIEDRGLIASTTPIQTPERLQQINNERAKASFLAFQSPTRRAQIEQERLEGREDVARREGTVATKELAGIALQGQVAQAVAGNQAALQDIQAKVRLEGQKGLNDLKTSLTDSIVGDFGAINPLFTETVGEGRDAKQQFSPEKFNDVFNQLSGQGQGEALYGDTDGDGQVSPKEQEAVNFMQGVMDKFGTLTPEQQAKFKNDPTFLKAQAIKAQLQKKASNEAQSVIR